MKAILSLLFSLSFGFVAGRPAPVGPVPALRVEVPPQQVHAHEASSPGVLSPWPETRPPSPAPPTEPTSPRVNLENIVGMKNSEIRLADLRQRIYSADPHYDPDPDAMRKKTYRRPGIHLKTLAHDVALGKPTPKVTWQQNDAETSAFLVDGGRARAEPWGIQACAVVHGLSTSWPQGCIGASMKMKKWPPVLPPGVVLPLSAKDDHYAEVSLGPHRVIGSSQINVFRNGYAIRLPPPDIRGKFAESHWRALHGGASGWGV